MSVTLTISEEKFSKDELSRNVTTLTQVYYESISYDLSQDIEDIICRADEKGTSVMYCGYESGTFEVYGDVVNSILSHIATKCTVPVVAVGGIDKEQLYEVSMSC